MRGQMRLGSLRPDGALPYLLVTVSFGVHLVALLVLSAFYASGSDYPYSIPIDWAVLLDGAGRIDLSALSRATEVWDWLLLAAAPIGLAVLLVTMKHPDSWWRFGFFAVQPIFFKLGWIGLVLTIAFPLEAISGLDGEWLGEHSPTLMSTGLWIATSLILAARVLVAKRLRGRSVVGGEANGSSSS